jgi:hypothetical protein
MFMRPAALRDGRRRRLPRPAALTFLTLIVWGCGGIAPSKVLPPAFPGKPYLTLLERVDGFAVWIVSGEYVRENLDEEFTNFGQHYRFPFIPRGEFWLDRENVPGEKGFFVDHLLVEYQLMALGMDYPHALDKGDAVEQAERAETRLDREGQELRRTHQDERLLRMVHKELLAEWSTDVKVWVVDGELVRDLYDIDFTEGGHDKVYRFIPDREVWIDDDVMPGERPFILLHEMHERRLMSRGWSYKKAHADASRIESYCRHHPEALEEMLRREISQNR